jgi:hypothetical protein
MKNILTNNSDIEDLQSHDHLHSSHLFFMQPVSTSTLPKAYRQSISQDKRQ